MTHQSILPESIHSMPVEKQETLLYLAMKDVVAKHICIEFNPTQQQQMCQDGVVEYSRELLPMGMLLLEFHDAIREGDGERVFWWWKFLFLIFMPAGRIKYTVERNLTQLNGVNAYFWSDTALRHIQVRHSGHAQSMPPHQSNHLHRIWACNRVEPCNNPTMFSFIISYRMTAHSLGSGWYTA